MAFCSYFPHPLEFFPQASFFYVAFSFYFSSSLFYVVRSISFFIFTLKNILQEYGCFAHAVWIGTGCLRANVTDLVSSAGPNPTFQYDKDPDPSVKVQKFSLS
jgi:hypothetical protein